MAGLGGTFVEFLLLVTELYLLWRHKHTEQRRKVQSISAVAPLQENPHQFNNRHNCTILPSRFSCKLAALCSQPVATTDLLFFSRLIPVSEAVSPSSVAVRRLGCCHRNPTWPCLLPGCSPDCLSLSCRSAPTNRNRKTLKAQPKAYSLLLQCPAFIMRDFSTFVHLWADSCTRPPTQSHPHNDPTSKQ